jgi:hypothetical protein
MERPLASVAARSTTFSSSRTFPRPVVLVEPLDRFLVEAVELLAHPRRCALQEVLGQERDVLGPFLEARDPDRDDGQR